MPAEAGIQPVQLVFAARRIDGRRRQEAIYRISSNVVCSFFTVEIQIESCTCQCYTLLVSLLKLQI